MVRARRKNPRNRAARRGGIETVVYPFVANISMASAGSKQLTAGDLGLDLTRPLRLVKLTGKAVILSLASSAGSLITTLVADGQEGNVSRPLLLSAQPSPFSVSQNRVMDFGLYGTNGTLAVFAHTAVVSATAETSPILSIVGEATIQYKRSESLRVVTLTLRDLPGKEDSNGGTPGSMSGEWSLLHQ